MRPSIEASSSGLAIACSAASSARLSPRALPMPIRAEPAPDMTDLTSAKSRLIRPGVVIRSVMPWTPDSSTWSAVRKASITLTLRSPSCSSRSFGITISVSHSLRGSSIPDSAWTARRLPSKANGRVTTPMVSAPSLRAIDATTGAPPVPVPPPSPRRHEDHVGPLEDLLDLLAVVLGGLAAHVGLSAAPRPRVSSGRRRA